MKKQAKSRSRWRRVLGKLFKPAPPRKPPIRTPILKTPFYY